MCVCMCVCVHVRACVCVCQGEGYRGVCFVHAVVSLLLTLISSSTDFCRGTALAQWTACSITDRDALAASSGVKCLHNSPTKVT